MHAYQTSNVVALRAVQAGDREAAAYLVTQYEARVRHWVAGFMSGRRDERSDVVQDVLFEAFRGLHNVRAESGTIEPWLRTVTHNVVRRFFRNERRRSWCTVCDPHLLDRHVVESLPSDQSELRRAMSDLPTLEFELLSMRYIEGRPLREIADRLKISRSSVQRQLARAEHRARQRLICYRDVDIVQQA